jgi:Tfp pilus assembly protein PilN
MQNIDFLPQEYRQRRARRHGQSGRIVAIAGIGALIVAAAFGQRYQRRQADDEMATVAPVYDTAVAQQQQLDGLQSQLQTARAAAELYAYLRHPWPRTQLLAALLGPLPAEIGLDQVQIVRETAPAVPVANVEGSPAGNRPNAETDLAKLLPAQRDLRQLRDELDKMRTVIHLSGTTSDTGQLHGYLHALGRSDLFAKAELDSLESAEGSGASRFRATLVVRPGYGQPGGPAPQPKPALAQAERIP